MGQVSFNAIPERETNNTPNGSFDFFSLKNDGDEAIVRIMHDNTESFNIFAVHNNVFVDGKRRNLNCIRDPRDPLDKCPFCASGHNTVYKMYIYMSQYYQDPTTGAIASKPVVWERSLTYATKLKTLIDEYGPLSDSIFKIKRNGAAGSMETTYDILYCNPKVYNDQSYPKPNGDSFNSIKILGTMVLNKTADEMRAYLANGSFPTQVDATDNSSMNYTPKSEPTVTLPQEYQNTQTPISGTPPWETSNTANPPIQMTPPSRTAPAVENNSPGRPARYY